MIVKLVVLVLVAGVGDVAGKDVDDGTCSSRLSSSQAALIFTTLTDLYGLFIALRHRYIHLHH
jgi:hypothetical protein